MERPFPDTPTIPRISLPMEEGWFRLRLAVAAPMRCPSWDAIVLTAASPQQSALYTRQDEVPVFRIIVEAVEYDRKIFVPLTAAGANAWQCSI